MQGDLEDADFDQRKATGLQTMITTRIKFRYRGLSHPPDPAMIAKLSTDIGFRIMYGSIASSVGGTSWEISIRPPLFFQTPLAIPFHSQFFTSNHCTTLISIYIRLFICFKLPFYTWYQPFSHHLQSYISIL